MAAKYNYRGRVLLARAEVKKARAEVVSGVLVFLGLIAVAGSIYLGRACNVKLYKWGYFEELPALPFAPSF